MNNQQYRLLITDFNFYILAELTHVLTLKFTLQWAQWPWRKQWWDCGHLLSSPVKFLTGLIPAKTCCLHAVFRFKILSLELFHALTTSSVKRALQDGLRWFKHYRR